MSAYPFEQRFYPEIGAGGFSRIDSTVAFYQRVAALIGRDTVLLDYGAGRGVGHIEDRSDFRRSMRNFQGKVATVIGVDVDQAVTTNPTLNEAHVITPDGRLPLADASIDVVLADFVFEHIVDPARAAAELDRVLKPGGWICARTINRHGYIALANRLIPELVSMKVLRFMQPARHTQDVFPAVYRMNSFAALSAQFPADRFEHFSYTWTAEPGYHAGKPLLYRFMQVMHYLTPAPLRPILMIFIRKRA